MILKDFLKRGLICMLIFLSFSVCGSGIVEHQEEDIKKPTEEKNTAGEEVKEPKEEDKVPKGGFLETFDGKFIDESIWRIAEWEEHGGQTGRDRCYVKDGNLNMILKNNNGQILSSAIETKQRFLYGRWEANIKPSSVPGVLNSFYTIDWTDALGREGTKQEIDIEFLTYTFGENKGEVHFAVHSHGMKSWASYDQIKLDFNPSEDFHVWGFNVLPDKIEWFVDNKILYTYLYKDHEIKIDAPYQIKLNAWTQRDWINGPPKSGVESVYLIDWIKFTPFSEE